MKYVCQICGYVYDEEREKTKFSDLPDSWTCPLCGAEKANFKPEREEAEAADTKNEEARPSIMREAEPDMKQLSFGELSVLCSNLARGCEKQYMPEEAKLYSELAEYFRRAEPKPEEADMETILKTDTRSLSGERRRTRTAERSGYAPGAERSRGSWTRW